MDKSSIKKYNFENAKNQIKRFSEELPSAPTIDRVEVDGGLFGWGDHKVTGSEFNNRMGDVQTGFIDINTSLRTIIKAFGTVYETLHALDNEYINGIIANMEKIDKNCQQVQNAQSDIKDTQYDLRNTQADLKKNVENLKLAVEKLSGLKNAHSELKNNVENLKLAVEKLSGLKNAHADLKNKVNNLIKIVDELKSKRTQIDDSIYGKKIKIVYWIAGGAIALTATNVVLQLLGIL